MPMTSFQVPMKCTVHVRLCISLKFPISWKNWFSVVVTNYSAFPSSCNFRLQQRQPCEPIREQNLNPSAIWLDGTVLALATGCCKNLEKCCIAKPWLIGQQILRLQDTDMSNKICGAISECGTMPCFWSADHVCSAQLASTTGIFSAQ